MKQHVDYASCSYNAQGKPIEQKVPFSGDITSFLAECSSKAAELTNLIEEDKSRLSILKTNAKYLDYSPNAQAITQRKFIELIGKGYVIRKSKDFFLDVNKIIKNVNVYDLLNQINFKPKGAKQTLEQLINDAIKPVQLTKHRIFATPIPYYFCNNCDDIFLPSSNFPIESRIVSSKCPKCNKESINEPTDTLAPLFDLTLQGYCLEPEKPTVDIQICGKNVTTKYAFFTFLVHAALDNCPPSKNLIIHNILNDECGRRMSRRNKNVGYTSDFYKVFHEDAIRYLLIKSLSLDKDVTNINKGFLEGGQKFVYKIGNLRKFFKQRDFHLTEYALKKDVTDGYCSLMDDFDLNNAFFYSEAYLTGLSIKIKKEHDSRSLRDIESKATEYKTALFMLEPFLPKIVEKSKEELFITPFLT